MPSLVVLDPVPHVDLVGLTAVFGFQAHAGTNAAQGTANRQRGPSAAEVLVMATAPPVLLNAAHLHTDVGVGADKDAAGQDAVLPASVEKSTLEEQDGHGPGVGDPELGDGGSAV
jgi:hypothetical protein